LRQCPWVLYILLLFFFYVLLRYLFIDGFLTDNIFNFFDNRVNSGFFNFEGGHTIEKVLIEY